MKQDKIQLIKRLEERVEKHLQTAIQTFQNLPEIDLLRPSAGGGWGIAQCLDHLNRYGDYYLPQIEAALQRGTPGKNSDIFKGSWLGSYFTRMMEPETGKKKIKAFKAYIPPPTLDAYAVVATFIQQQEVLLEYLKLSSDVDLDGQRIPVSIARWIKLKLGDVLQFVIAHNERHVQQALRNLEKAAA